MGRHVHHHHAMMKYLIESPPFPAILWILNVLLHLYVLRNSMKLYRSTGQSLEKAQSEAVYGATSAAANNPVSTSRDRAPRARSDRLCRLHAYAYFFSCSFFHPVQFSKGYPPRPD